MNFILFPLFLAVVCSEGTVNVDIDSETLYATISNAFYDLKITPRNTYTSFYFIAI